MDFKKAALVKKKIILLVAIVGLAYACKSPKSTEVNPADLVKTATYAFSDTAKLDTFKVAITGKQLSEMKLVFTIHSFNGSEIYKQEVSANELLKSYLASAEMKDDEDKVNFLKEEISYFFDEKHFLEPAVTENETPDKNVPDVAFYNELKESNLNGFEYRFSKDKSYYIAWSAMEQKVKVYYKCC